MSAFFNKHSVPSLRAVLKAAGVRVGGNKADLVKRLVDGKIIMPVATVATTPPKIQTVDDAIAKPKNTTRGDVKTRKLLQRVNVMTTVKCSLKRKIVDPVLLLPILDSLVEYVSRTYRVGSLAFNAMLLHVLVTNDGSLAGWINVESDSELTTFLRQCFTGPGGTTPRSHDTLFATVPNLRHLRDEYPRPLTGASQSVTYAAKNYATVFRNHVVVHLLDRIKTFCTRACRAFPGMWTVAYRFVTLHPFDEDPPMDLALPTCLATVFTRLAGMWRLCADNNLLRPRIELLFFLQVQSDLREFPGWSVAPVCGYERKHVELDAAIFKGYLAPRLKTAGVYGASFHPTCLSTEEAKQHLLALFKDVHKLRTPPAAQAPGWVTTGAFKTDGYSLCVTFVHTDRRKDATPTNPRERRAPVVGVRRQIVGIDPGRQNILCVAGYNGTGVPYVCSYTARRYEVESGIRSSKEQHARWNRSVAPILDGMSRDGAAIRTCRLDKQALYMQTSAAGHDELCAALGHKKSVRNRMAVYIGKRRSLDAFLRSVPIRRGVRLEVAYGNAKFRPAGVGTVVPAPCSLAYERVRLWADEVVPQDEFRTTKYSHYGECELEDVIVQTAGPRRRVTSRGLKRCTTQRTLGLLRTHKLPEGWREDPARPGTTLVSRDGNAALNIRGLLARGHRPRWLRRGIT